MIKNIKWLSLFAAFLFLFAGCGENENNPDDSISKLQDGDLIVRENVNEISVAVSSFDTFNPIMTKSQSVAEFLKTVCEPLFEYDEALNPIGVLAKDYRVSQDGMVVSFNVENVKFHDSTDLTPNDVVYTINMIRNNDTLYADSVKYITDVFSDGGGRIYIKLLRPVVNFAGNLNFPIVKSGTPNVADPNFIPVGTGPCKYQGKKNSNQITFTAHKEWHGGETGFKDIVVNVLKDSDTMVHAFDAGEVDVIGSKFSKNTQTTPRGEYSVNEYTSSALTFLGINNKSVKLSGKLTRQAIELLIDRKKIIDVEVYSKGTEAKIPVNPSGWFYPDYEEAQKNYGEVEALLSRDGWVKTDEGFRREINGNTQYLSLRILVNKENPEKMRIAKNIASSLNTFGITASTREVSYDMYKECVKEKDYELFVGEVMTDLSMDPYFLTDPEDNYFNYSNIGLKNALIAAAQTADTKLILERMRAYADIFRDEMPFVPLFFRNQSVIYNKYISGISPPTDYMIYRDIDKWYISKTNQ